MSFPAAIILIVIITTLVEAIIFYWQHRRYQYYYGKEEHVFGVAKKIYGLLLQTSDATSVMQKVADFLPNELDFATGVIVLYEKDTRTLRRVAASSTKEAIAAIQALRVPFTKIAVPVDDPNNLMSRSIRERKEYITDTVHDVFTPVLTPEESATIQQILGTRSTIVYPIYAADNPLGVFVASSKKMVNELTPYEKEIISVFVDGAGISLQNSLYIASLQRTSEELKQANIQIAQAEKLKSDLLTMASHEFRTPLANIKNMLWALQQPDTQLPLSDKAKQYFTHLVTSVERLNYVVNNINQMLLATSGDLAQSFHVTAVQVERIIKEVLEDKEVEAIEAGVTLTYTEPANVLPPIEADVMKFKYVIYELVTNALKYTGRNGRVTLTSELHENIIVISVADTGRGNPAEHIPHLFDGQGFDKVDVIHTTQAGMGLGLYLIREIIHLHNGKIDASSTVGKGTTIHVTMPVMK